MSINYYQIWRNNSMTTVKEEEEERFVEKNQETKHERSNKEHVNKEKEK